MAYYRILLSYRVEYVSILLTGKIERIRVNIMRVEIVRHSGAYIISAFKGVGEDEYVYTRTYYGYSLRESKQLFMIALKGLA